jgi:hypothetical protein
MKLWRLVEQLGRITRLSSWCSGAVLAGPSAEPFAVRFGSIVAFGEDRAAAAHEGC